jgi:hypothetical protein
MRFSEEITPAALHAELRRIGYTESEADGPSGSTWVDQNDEERPAVLVPHAYDEDVRGYQGLLESAVERISWALEISVSETLERLSEHGDRFEMRIEDSSTRGGRLPVLRAPGVINGFLAVLRAGARAEFLGTQARYQGNDTEVVRGALAGIDLLAPAKGSFRLIAVTAAEAQMPFDRSLAIPDHTRRALASTVRGLRAAAEVAAEPGGEAERLPGAIDEGVSTTLLGGLEAISKRAPGMVVAFKVRWDPSLPEVEAPAGELRLRQEQLHRVPRLARALRERGPEEERVVSGWVRTATADELARAGHPSGLVIVDARIEGRKRNIQIELPSELFDRARPGTSQLWAKGTLQKIGNRWHLSNPREIRIDGVGPYEPRRKR